MYRAIPEPNKFLSKKWKNSNTSLHLSKLLNSKPIVDTLL